MKKEGEGLERRNHLLVALVFYLAIDHASLSRRNTENQKKKKKCGANANYGVLFMMFLCCFIY